MCGFLLGFLANSGLNCELYVCSLSETSCDFGSVFSPRCFASNCAVLCLSSISRFNLSALSCSIEALGFCFDEEEVLCLLDDFSLSCLCFFFLCFLCCKLNEYVCWLPVLEYVNFKRRTYVQAFWFYVPFHLYLCVSSFQDSSPFVWWDPSDPVTCDSSLYWKKTQKY